MIVLLQATTDKKQKQKTSTDFGPIVPRVDWVGGDHTTLPNVECRALCRNLRSSHCSEIAGRVGRQAAMHRNVSSMLANLSPPTENTHRYPHRYLLLLLPRSMRTTTHSGLPDVNLVFLAQRWQVHLSPRKVNASSALEHGAARKGAVGGGAGVTIVQFLKSTQDTTTRGESSRNLQYKFDGGMHRKNVPRAACDSRGTNYYSHREEPSC